MEQKITNSHPLVYLMIFDGFRFKVCVFFFYDYYFLFFSWCKLLEESKKPLKYRSFCLSVVTWRVTSVWLFANTDKGGPGNQKREGTEGCVRGSWRFFRQLLFLINVSYLLAKQSFLQKFFPGWNCESLIMNKTSFTASWCAPGEELEESEGWLSSRECYRSSAVCIKGAEILNRCQN